MMADGGRWAQAAGLTQIIVVLAPIFAVGITGLIACAQARQAAIAPPAPLALAFGHALRAAPAALSGPAASM